MKMFSCPPSINKNKEVTSFVTNHVTYFCDKPTELASRDSKLRTVLQKLHKE